MSNEGMKLPPAQPGHLAGGKPFLKKQNDSLSVRARAITIDLSARARKAPERLSAPLDWGVTKKPKK